MLADDEIVFMRGSFVSVFRFRGYFWAKIGRWNIYIYIREYIRDRGIV